MTSTQKTLTSLTLGLPVDFRSLLSSQIVLVDAVQVSLGLGPVLAGPSGHGQSQARPGRTADPTRSKQKRTPSVLSIIDQLSGVSLSLLTQTDLVCARAAGALCVRPRA
jgi:hypothetical protein